VKLSLDRMKQLVFLLFFGIISSGCAGLPLPSQTSPSSAGENISLVTGHGGFEHLATFDQHDGEWARSGLTAVGDALYGNTYLGGDSACATLSRTCGVVYELKLGGIKRLHVFTGKPDGAEPWADLTNAKGTLYGMTSLGGNSQSNYCNAESGCGAIFKISTSGEETVVHSFENNPDGAYPGQDSLVYAKGALYGVTPGGGANFLGAIVRITLDGEESVVYSFTDADAIPQSISYVNGSFYIAATGSNGEGVGMIEELLADGKMKVLYIFSGSPDAAYPVGKLVAIDNTLYGASTGGGDPYCSGGCGTVYSLTTNGREHVLHEFNHASEGLQPTSGVVLARGVLYGAACCAFVGGGSIYKVTTSGEESVLHEFGGNGGDARAPYGRPLFFDGALYGTTGFGGRLRNHKTGSGTVFKVTP
jgi:uncharacterized repeat protein (TIGR03803 family)